MTRLEDDYICTEKGNETNISIWYENYYFFFLFFVTLFCMLVPLGARCLTDRDCNVNRHVECSKYGRCVCEPFTIQVDDSTCGLLIGDYCQDNEPCGPKHSVCIHNQCQCETNYFPQSNHICVQSKL